MRLIVHRVIAALSLTTLGVAGASSRIQPSHAGRVAAPVTVPGAPNCPIFPSNNVWNEDVSTLPVAANSAQMISSIGLTTGLHPDFGSYLGYGIPYNVVSGSQPKVPISFYYASESDPGPYPIPANPQIEGGSDHHLLIVDSDACMLYELWDFSGSSAGSGATWNLRSNALRPDGWTSADAAGLPILPGLVRYDEVAQGVIAHALRFTAVHTQNMHIYPARHDAGVNNTAYPPMGLRVRLKASVDISGFSPTLQVILTALKHYGMILADTGSNWYISGVSDTRWDDADLHNLNQITGADFEVVDTSTLVNGPDPATGTPTVATPSATGTPGTTLTATASPTATQQGFAYVVQAGWNFLALPGPQPTIVTASGLLTALLQQSNGTLAAIYGLTGNQWRPFYGEQPGGSLGADFSLQVGVGYLVYSDKTVNFTLASAATVGSVARRFGAGSAGAHGHLPPLPPMP